MATAEDVLNVVMGFAAVEYERGYKNGLQSMIYCDECKNKDGINWKRQCSECATLGGKDYFEPKEVE